MSTTPTPDPQGTTPADDDETTPVIDPTPPDGDEEQPAADPAPEPEAAPAAEPEAPTEPAEPEPEPEPAPVAPQPQQRAYTPPAPQPDPEMADVQADISALEKKINDGTYDQFEDGKALAKLQLKETRLRLKRQEAMDQYIREQQSQSQASRFWQDFEARNREVGSARGQQIWQEEIARAQTKYGDPGAIQAVANENFERRVKAIKAQIKPKAPPAAPGRTVVRPTLSRGGATVAPVRTATRPPPPRTRSSEEEVHEFARTAGRSPLALLGEE